MPRSLLFAGATRPDLVAKLGRAQPDAAVVDLEDAVPFDHKDRARKQARHAAERLAADHPELRVFVRVNSVASGLMERDVAAVASPRLAGVVLPKLESEADGARLAEALQAVGWAGAATIAGIETARGIARVEDVLARGWEAAYFGAEDLAADLGGRRTPAGDEVLYARSRFVIAARIHGVLPIDQAVVEFRDDEQFERDAGRGRDLGYTGKLCIHPRQVALAHAAFSPTQDEIDRATRVLAAAEQAASDGVGALEVDGTMVDEPLIRRARAVLRAADR